MKATVYVRLKREVLDPQGSAVERALGSLGFTGMKNVRIGKLIEFDVDPAGATEAEVHDNVRKMADELLANVVMEDYEIKLG